MLMLFNHENSIIHEFFNLYFFILRAQKLIDFVIIILCWWLSVTVCLVALVVSWYCVKFEFFLENCYLAGLMLGFFDFGNCSEDYV